MSEDFIKNFKSKKANNKNIGFFILKNSRIGVFISSARKNMKIDKRTLLLRNYKDIH